MWKFDGKKIDIIADTNKKEWFCGKDACEILGFKNANDALLKQVKRTYKTDLKSIRATCDPHVTPLSHNARLAVCISRDGII